MKQGLKLRLKKCRFLCILCIACMLVFSLTGCDELPGNLSIELLNAAVERVALNMEFVDDLYKSGLVSEPMRDSIKSELTASQKKIIEDLSDLYDAKGSVSSALASIVAWRVPPEYDHMTDAQSNKYFHGRYNEIVCAAADGVDCGEFHDDIYYKQCKTHINLYMTNTLANMDVFKILGIKTEDESKVAKIAQKYIPALGGDKVVPVSLLSESLEDKLNEELNIPVYVLKSNTDVNLATLTQAIGAYEKNMGTEAEEEISKLLLTHFEPAEYIDSNGVTKTLKVLDTNDATQKLVTVTCSSYDDPYTDQSEFTGEIVNMYHYTGFKNFPSEVDRGKLGIDMVISNAGEPVMALRLREFNQVAYDNLKKRIGLGEGRFLVVDGTAYLMEYPIGYIEGFEENSEDTSTINPLIARSELTYNIKTGKIGKCERNADGSFSATSTPVNGINEYINAANSLMIYGETGITGKTDEKLLNGKPWDLQVGYSEDSLATVSTARIVLTEYLEITYAPDVVDNEELVAFGRKFKIFPILNSSPGDSWKKSDPIATVYSLDGTEILNGDMPIQLFIDDFADVEALRDSKTVEYIPRRSTSGGEGTEEDTTAKGDAASTGEDDEEPMLVNKLGAIESLATKTVAEIKPSVLFPTNKDNVTIASQDATSIYTESKPLMYGMIVRENIFNTGLFSGWIMNSNLEKDSLRWWNQWLSNNGYNYNINENNLTNYLTVNYSSYLSKDGVLTLDLSTISDINRQQEQKEQKEAMVIINTVFKLLGYLLVFYGMAIIVAWAVDTNVDLGVGYLGKLSLGQWVAIKDPEELPVAGTTTLYYMSFKNVLIRSMIVISLGITLIMLPIVKVIAFMVITFGGIGEFINQIISGLR